MSGKEGKLVLENISKSYGKIKVLDSISLSVPPNEFFAVLGPSGAGKSTLLRIIIGVEEPDEGAIYIDGKDVTDLPPNKRNVAVVFQSYALYPNMNVYQNIAFPLKMRGMPSQEIRKRVIETANKLGIYEILGKNVTKISGGQKQRTALARALVRNPSIFLLDEPLSNLDARIRFKAREELRKLQTELKETFVYVTHDQSEVANLANRVAVLHNGSFEQIAPYRELYERPQTMWVGDFIGNYPMNFVSSRNLKVEHVEDGTVCGFRPEWVSLARDGNRATVASVETIGSKHYIYCELGDDHFIVETEQYIPPGTEVFFQLNRFNIYREGSLLREWKPASEA